jgi:hypothetical protein
VIFGLNGESRPKIAHLIAYGAGANWIVAVSDKIVLPLTLVHTA